MTTASIQQADTGDQPEGAVDHWEVEWAGVQIAFRLQPGGQFGELTLRRPGRGFDEGEVHAAIIPVCHHSINGVPVPPPQVIVDGVRYVPAPPEVDDASEDGEAAAIHGDVQQEPEQGSGQVSAEVGGEGVQSPSHGTTEVGTRWRIDRYHGDILCTTRGCIRRARWVFEAGGVGSYHCDPCIASIRRLLDPRVVNDPVPFP
jgi:hypothetical protein